ncbi:MAG: hypothetical protein ABIP65_06240 [Vicinamibacterales bacterium]
MRSAAIGFTVILAISLPAVAATQMTSRPTPPPPVTAESEEWYLNGDPITYSGQPYYLAGPQIHFNANEMVRSGSFLGVPLYSRTTVEPYSIVFVPLAGGLMQPYERRRDGDLAGTSGSAVSSLPTVSAPDVRVARPPQAAATARTAAPDVRATPPLRPVGTAGRVGVPSRTKIGEKPRGVNAIFVSFQNRRWYSEGPAVALDEGHMIRIGELRGFSVFSDLASRGSRIYVQVAAGGSMVAPYADRRQPK